MHTTFYYETREIFSYDLDVLPQIGNFFWHAEDGSDINKGLGRRCKYEVIRVDFSAREIRSGTHYNKSCFVEVYLKLVAITQ